MRILQGPEGLGQARASARGASPRRVRRPERKRRDQRAILQSLAGVGSKWAQRLLAAFAGVEVVLTAGVRRWETVPGVGRRTAPGIHLPSAKPRRRIVG